MSVTNSRQDEIDRVAAADAAQLAELGYKQELRRTMSGFTNFAVSFSIISILAGCITSYAIAMNAGGPIAISLGWPIVGFFVWLVSMAMAEICSVYPTAGGLYWWAGRLARRNKREWAWTVGWFNFMGEVGVTAAVDFGAAVTFMAFFREVAGVDVNPVSTFVCFLVLLASHGLLNAFGVNLVKLLTGVSAWWHLAGAAIILVVLAFVPAQHQSAGWTLTHFVNNTGWDNPLYAGIIGLLMAQYTLTGFDPARIPPLLFDIADLRLGEAVLGNARFRSVPGGGGLRMEEFTTRGGKQRLRASGTWSGRAAAARIDRRDQSPGVSARSQTPNRDDQCPGSAA